MLTPRCGEASRQLATMPRRSTPDQLELDHPREPAGAGGVSLFAIDDAQARRFEPAQRIASAASAFSRRHLEVHHARRTRRRGSPSGSPAQLAPKPLRAVGQQAARCRAGRGPIAGDDQRRGRRRRRPRSATTRAADHRRARREALVLRLRRQRRRARARGARRAASRSRPIGASARSHSSRAVSPLARRSTSPARRSRPRPSRRRGGRPSRRRSGRLRGSSIRPRRCRDGAAAATGDSRCRRRRERASASLLTRACVCAATIRSVPSGIASPGTIFGLSTSTCTGTPAACAASAEPVVEPRARRPARTSTPSLRRASNTEAPK